MYLITTWFATFLWSKDGADKVHRADNDPGAVAHRLERLGRLDILEEERELAEGLRSEGKVDDPNLKVCEPRLEPLGEVVAEPSDLDIDVLAQEWGYGPQLLHEAVLRLGRDTARQAQGLDLQLLQAVAASDELVEVANLLGERVAQWEGLSLPEVSLTMRPAALAKAISSAPDRETLAQEREVDLQETLGVEADPTGRTALEGLARLTTETAVEQERLARNIETLMEQVAPNVAAVAGPLLGARLLALTGGLGRMARMPSSAVQLLGAETALFRHLKSGAKPPKHGAIYQHPLVHQTQPRQRGKAARALASKVTIAARIDHFAGDFAGDELRQQVQDRVETLRKQTGKSKGKGKSKGTGKGKGK